MISDIDKIPKAKLINEFLRFACDNWEKIFPPHIVSVWLEDLVAYPLTILESVFKRARRRKYPPNLGDIVEMADELTESQRIAAANARPEYLLLRDAGDKPPDWVPLAYDPYEESVADLNSAIATAAQDMRMPDVKPEDCLSESEKHQLHLQKLTALKAWATNAAKDKGWL